MIGGPAKRLERGSKGERGGKWKLVFLFGVLGLIAPGIMTYEAWLSDNNLLNEPAFVWMIPYFFPGDILTFADPFPPNFWGKIIFPIAVISNVMLYAIVGFVVLRLFLLEERGFELPNNVGISLDNRASVVQC